MTIGPGATLGPYQIMNQLGRGGMAAVYRAYHTRLDRYVAIKVVLAAISEDEGFLARFEQEAKAVARFRHPAIITIHDFGDANGVAYLVTELIEGGTLAERTGRPLDPYDVSQLIAPVASALDYAHARGVLHRDVKPANILLRRDGTPVLSDFGIAKLADSVQHFTRTGAVMGTPAYQAPEQAQGDPAVEATDQYALGVVAYELLTGRLPFSAETPLAVLLAHLVKPLPAPRTINPALSEEIEQALTKVLAKKPGDRFPNVSAFAAALAAAARNGDVMAAPAGAGTAIPSATPPSTPLATPAVTPLATSVITSPSSFVSAAATPEAITAPADLPPATIATTDRAIVTPEHVAVEEGAIETSPSISAAPPITPESRPPTESRDDVPLSAPTVATPAGNDVAARDAPPGFAETPTSDHGPAPSTVVIDSPTPPAAATVMVKPEAAAPDAPGATPLVPSTAEPPKEQSADRATPSTVLERTPKRRDTMPEVAAPILSATPQQPQGGAPTIAETVVVRSGAVDRAATVGPDVLRRVEAAKPATPPTTRRTPLLAIGALAAVAVLVGGFVLLRGAFGGAQNRPAPTALVVSAPTSAPTSVPTVAPVIAPTRAPTGVVTSAPTPVPTSAPTASPVPTATTAPSATSAPTKTSAPTATPVAASAWPATANALNAVWGNDWPKTISTLESFRATYPDFPEAKDKLYAALVAYGNQLVSQGNPAGAVAQYQRAQTLEPDRTEAGAALAALTPTAVPPVQAQPTATPIPYVAPTAPPPPPPPPPGRTPRPGFTPTF